jgi:hypothetical protein
MTSKVTAFDETQSPSDHKRLLTAILPVQKDYDASRLGIAIMGKD